MLGGNQLSSSKYEELLGILIDHKLTFENHLLNIVQKVTKNCTPCQEYLSTCLGRN